MSMTPEEIDEIYIQEHGMTKGAFSVGLQGSLMHRNSVEEWAEGDPVKVWLEGRDTGEKSTVCIAYESGRWWHYKKGGQRFCLVVSKRGALRVLSFFCIYDNPDGDPRARSRAWVFCYALLFSAY
jgi:hypothetical protein